MSIFLLSLSCCLVGGNAAPVLAENGRSDCVILQSREPSPSEAFAARELAEFLRRSTGAALAIRREAEFKGGKAIYLGQTDFARRQKIDFAALGPEEWILRSVDGNLIVAGGRPRGTLYAVYELLEKYVGVRFLDADMDFVPSRRTLTLPAELAVRQSPAFFRREIYVVTPRQPKHTLFQVRRKINGCANAAVSWEPEVGFSLRFGSPYSTHTHHLYTKDFPIDKPEYFALLASGRRAAPGSDGQVCMSHPEMRRLFATRLRRYIEQDRQAITAAGRGEPFPLTYSLVPNDNTNKCVCEKCRALADKYGAYSGVVLEFTNAIADDIARDYPEIRIATGAYTFYLDVPRGIRPRDNVIIYMAQLGAEFNSLPKRDTLRSLTHPVNEKPRRILEQWSGIAKALGVHDYWTTWSQPFLSPHANVHGLAQTLKLYHRCGMKDFFVEDELFGSRLHNFVDLEVYMATALLQDPARDETPIIGEFMELYYGPAAPLMKRLLEYIERRQEEQPGMLATVPPAARRYFDAAFFLETDALLSEAEQRVSGDAKRLANVRQERLAIDETMLHLWHKLNSPRRLPFPRDAVLERLQRSYEEGYRKYGGWGEAHKRQDRARLEYLRNLPPVPPQFAGKKIIDLCGPQLALGQSGGNVVRAAVPDAAATMGKAWRLDSSLPGSPGNHAKPPQFGLYDNQTKELVKQVIAPGSVPKDEKYHLYLAGRMRGSSSMYFWAHHSWRLAQRLQMAYDSSLPEQKVYDVYVSVKLEGPAYVPGSTRPNGFSIDRIILVEIVPTN